MIQQSFQGITKSAPPLNLYSREFSRSLGFKVLGFRVQGDDDDDDDEQEEDDDEDEDDEEDDEGDEGGDDDDDDDDDDDVVTFNAQVA